MYESWKAAVLSVSDVLFLLAAALLSRRSACFLCGAGSLERPLRDSGRSGPVHRSDGLFGLPNIVPAPKLTFIPLQLRADPQCLLLRRVHSAAAPKRARSWKSLDWSHVTAPQPGVLFPAFTCRLQHRPFEQEQVSPGTCQPVHLDHAGQTSFIKHAHMKRTRTPLHL